VKKLKNLKRFEVQIKFEENGKVFQTYNKFFDCENPGEAEKMARRWAKNMTDGVLYGYEDMKVQYQRPTFIKEVVNYG